MVRAPAVLISTGPRSRGIWSSGVDASTVMDLDEAIAALLGDAVHSTVVGQTASASAGAIFEMLLFNDFSLLEISFARSFYIWETFYGGRIFNRFRRTYTTHQA